MSEQIKPNRPYPIQIKLRDARTASIRLMEPRDVDKIIEFAKTLPADDLLFLRTDITDRAIVKQWADAIKSGNTITLLAEAYRRERPSVVLLDLSMTRMGGMEALDAPYLDVGVWAMIRKRAGWLAG